MQTVTNDNATARAARSSDDPISVSVIVVHYGDDQLLARCLDSVAASVRVSARAIVVGP